MALPVEGCGNRVWNGSFQQSAFSTQHSEKRDWQLAISNSPKPKATTGTQQPAPSSVKSRAMAKNKMFHLEHFGLPAIGYVLPAKDEKQTSL